VPAEPPRLRVERRRADAAPERREVVVFADDTVATALVKIAAAFGERSVPYLWKAGRSVAFTVRETPWRAAYRADPFAVPEGAEGTGAPTAALSPTLRLRLEALWSSVVSGDLVYAAFASDVPKALRDSPAAASHYFPIAANVLRATEEVSRETAALSALWADGTRAPAAGAPLVIRPSNYQRVTFRAPIAPAAAARIAAAGGLAAIWAKLRASPTELSLLQWTTDGSRVLYKLAERHPIPAALLDRWTSPDRLPTVPMIQGWSMLLAGAEGRRRDQFARVAILPGEVSVTYELDPRENVRTGAIAQNYDRLRRRVVAAIASAAAAGDAESAAAPLGAAVTDAQWRETDVYLRTEFRLTGLTVASFARSLASAPAAARALFHVLRFARTAPMSLDMVAVRASNSRKKDIAEYVASRLLAGAVLQDVLSELAEATGMSAEEVAEAAQRGVELARKPAAGVVPRESEDIVALHGMHVRLLPTAGGIVVQLNGVASRDDLVRTMHWLRCVSARAPFIAPPAAPAEAAPAPGAEAGPSRPRLAAAPAAPRAPSLAETESVSSGEIDLSFIEGGAAQNFPDGYFLKPLNAADPRLFSPAKYAASCGVTPLRQPIVLSPEEKAEMDAEGYGASYTDAMTYGSDAEHQNVYMCPALWCPDSRRPMTPAQYAEKGCPKGEQAIHLYDKPYWKNSPATPRHIGLQNLYKDTHGMCIPCCGISPLKKNKIDECSRAVAAAAGPKPSAPKPTPGAPGPSAPPSGPGPSEPGPSAGPAAPSAPTPTPTPTPARQRRAEEKNILKRRAPIDANRYGSVPQVIHDVLLPDTDYALCTEEMSSHECFVRRGTGAGPTSPPGVPKDSFMAALQYVLGFPSEAAFLKAIRARLDPLSFVALENGHVLQAFAPADAILPEDLTDAERRAFQRWRSAWPAYAALFATPDAHATSRELALFSAYRDFFAHLKSDEPKSPYLFYDVARLFGVTLVLWELTDAKGGVAQVRCPVFKTMDELLARSAIPADGDAAAGSAGAGPDPLVSMILKDGAHYEPMELARLSAEGKRRLTQARVGSAFLKDTLGAGCPAPSERDFGAASAVIGRLRAYARWCNEIPTDTSDEAPLRPYAAILTPDLRVARIVTRGGLHIVLGGERPGPADIAALSEFLGLRAIYHQEDVAGQARPVRCLSADLSLFARKTAELGFGAEAGVPIAAGAPGAAPAAGVYSAVLAAPPPDPSGALPVLLAGSRADRAVARGEDAKAREVSRMTRHVAQTLLYYYRDLVVPLLGRPRPARVRALMNTFPRYPSRERLEAILTGLPLENRESLAEHIRNLSGSRAFYAPGVRLERGQKADGRRNEWLFSQAAVEVGLPAPVRRPVAPGAARPSATKLPEAGKVQERAAAFPEPGEPGAAAPLPRAISEAAPTPLPSKWQTLKTYNWTKFAVMRVAESRPSDVREFFQWLSRDLGIPLSWRDVLYAAAMDVSSALADRAATEALSHDAYFRAVWLRAIGRDPASVQRTVFLEILQRMPLAARQNKWREIMVSASEWPMDWTIAAAARLLDISVLVLLQRAAHGAQKGVARRGGLEDLVGSCRFFSPVARNRSAVMKRPLVVLFKEAVADHTNYYVVRPPAPVGQYYRLAAEAPRDVAALLTELTAAPASSSAPAAAQASTSGSRA